VLLLAVVAFAVRMEEGIARLEGKRGGTFDRKIETAQSISSKRIGSTLDHNGFLVVHLYDLGDDLRPFDHNPSTKSLMDRHSI